MARYIGASCRLCRAEGQKLFLKGSRCYSHKCSAVRRSNGPGQHGSSRKKSSEYGLQLRAKQKARRYYGILEKQFVHYYDLAEHIKEGKSGENMLSIIERRIDNVVYRLGWCGSRSQSRQHVRHGNFCVNDKKVDIASYIVEIDDKISLSKKGLVSESIKNIIKANVSRSCPKWLEFTNPEHTNAKVISAPEREDIDLEVDETLIIELYSK
ncbi:MAG: 30S ribosomal protein S4 [Firmicutes bacterium]|nr:30S ribosomal protein S4 [Bacillota bacterium]